MRFTYFISVLMNLVSFGFCSIFFLTDLTKVTIRSIIGKILEENSFYAQGG